MAAIVDSGVVSIPIPNDINGIYMNLVTGASGTSSSVVGWDINPYFTTTGTITLHFFATTTGDAQRAVVGASAVASALPLGTLVGPSSTFVTGVVNTTGTTFLTTATSYLGARFTNEGTGVVNYGWVQIATTAGTGNPAIITQYAYENTGAPIAVGPAPPAIVSAVLRRTHGVAGTFDLPLSLVPTAPTTEPRAGPDHQIVVTFDKAIAGGVYGISEGTASPSGGSVGGNQIFIGFTGVSDVQYMTTYFNLTSSDGGVLNGGQVRVGFLEGDVNQTGQVTVADVGIVNGSLLAPITILNFFRDVNADGKLTVADKGLTNIRLLNKLPAP